MPETQGTEALPGILARIVETKRAELVTLRARRALLETEARAADPPRDFRSALAAPGSVSLIAECKRRSPGAGAIRPELDPAELASGYERAGAAALSVLTDTEYFGGSAADLRRAREAVSIPVLRKDFTLDPLQIVEARAMGADAVLLIARILDDDTMELLQREATGLGMAALVEVHDRDELERAARLGAPIVGINNRDLATFTTRIETTLELLGSLPADTVVVSESGIRTRGDVELLGEGGVDAILVGESLLSAEDPAAAAAELTAVATSARSVA